MISGKRSFKKDIDHIVAAHGVPYQATLSIAHWNDFVRKVEKAKQAKGFRFLHVLTPCVPGWRSEASKSMEIARLAVETGMWTLYEAEKGESALTYKPKKMEPVIEYLKLQGRFKHMTKEDIDTLQRWRRKRWDQRYSTGMVTEERPKDGKELAFAGEETEGL